jgi:transcriptional regulator with XRE-family HTH domain
MTEGPPSSARLRRIGRALRQIREESGYTLKAAGNRLERSGSSLSLIEKGMQSLRLRDLKFILDTYEAPPDLHQALMPLAQQEQQPGWWDDFADTVTRHDLDYASLEAHAARLDAFETGFVPGLLQTEEYARAVIGSAVAGLPPEKVERFVGFRLARQQILQSTPEPQLHVIMDEAALRRSRGGRHVMRDQLQKLLDHSQEEHITVQVLPFSLEADPDITETFWILDIGRPAILSAVLLTHLTGRVSLEAQAEIDHYNKAFARLRTASLSEAETRAWLLRIISEL